MFILCGEKVKTGKRPCRGRGGLFLEVVVHKCCFFCFLFLLWGLHLNSKGLFVLQLGSSKPYLIYSVIKKNNFFLKYKMWYWHLQIEVYA